MPGTLGKLSTSLWNNSTYEKRGSLLGHTQSINCVDMNPDGRLLASGGDDRRVGLWDINNLSRVCWICDESWSEITSLRWINSALLCIGTANGIMTLYRAFTATEWREMGCDECFDGKPVESLAWDSVSKKLAAAGANGLIRVWKVQDEGTIRRDWDYIPGSSCRGIAFINNGTTLAVWPIQAGDKKLGELHLLNVETGKCREEPKQAKSRIGNVNVSPRGREYVVDNLRNGFDVYSFKNSKLSEKIRPPSYGRLFVKQAAFVHGSKAIACGSDHGRLYVWDREGSRLEGLTHIDDEDVMVQTVASFTLSSMDLIVSGASGDHPAICLWRKREKPIRIRSCSIATVGWLFLMVLVTLALLLAAGAISVSISCSFLQLFQEWAPFLLRTPIFQCSIPLSPSNSSHSKPLKSTVDPLRIPEVTYAPKVTHISTDTQAPEVIQTMETFVEATNIANSNQDSFTSLPYIVYLSS